MVRRRAGFVPSPGSLPRSGGEGFQSEPGARATGQDPALALGVRTGAWILRRACPPRSPPLVGSARRSRERERADNQKPESRRAGASPCRSLTLMPARGDSPAGATENSPGRSPGKTTGTQEQSPGGATPRIRPRGDSDGPILAQAEVPGPSCRPSGAIHRNGTSHPTGWRPSRRAGILFCPLRDSDAELLRRIHTAFAQDAPARGRNQTGHHNQTPLGDGRNAHPRIAGSAPTVATITNSVSVSVFLSRVRARGTVVTVVRNAVSISVGSDARPLDDPNTCVGR